MAQKRILSESGERNTHKRNAIDNMRLRHNPMEKISSMCCSTKPSQSPSPWVGQLNHRRPRPTAKDDNSVETAPLEESLRSFKSEELAQAPILRRSSNTVSLGHSFGSSTNKSVSFGDIQIHSHQFTLGDNPSVSSGPPVTVDWKAFESGTYDLDEYEQQKPDPRRKEAMILPRSIREEILRNEGFSRGELKEATGQVSKIQQHRLKSSKDGKLLRKFGKCLNALKPGSRDANGLNEASGD